MILWLSFVKKCHHMIGPSLLLVAIASRLCPSPLPVNVASQCCQSPSIAVAHFFECQFFTYDDQNISTGAWEGKRGDVSIEQTTRHFFCLSFVKRIFIENGLFCQKNFYSDGTVRHFFLVVFCLKFFDGDGTVWNFFLVVFCRHGDGSIEMGQCGNLFLVFFLPSPITCILM